MPPRKTIIENLTTHSVELNGLYYPANSVCNAALSYVAPLYFGNFDYPEYPLSAVGSAFKVRQNSRYVLFSSLHQHKHFDASQALLKSREEFIWISANGAVSPKNDNVNAYSDLIMMDYSEIVASGQLSNNTWYRLDLEYSYDKIIGCVAMGYPSDKNSVYEDPKVIQQNCMAVLGDYLGETIAGLHGMKPEKELTIDPDGMSGGPVFFIVRKHDVFQMIPAGIITNAGRKQINFSHARHLQRFISH